MNRNNVVKWSGIRPETGNQNALPRRAAKKGRLNHRRHLGLEMLRDSRHNGVRVIPTLCTYTNQRDVAAFKEGVFEDVVFLSAESAVSGIIQFDCGEDAERLSIAKQEVHMLRADPVKGHLVSPGVFVDFKDVSEPDFGEETIITRRKARLQASEEFGLCRSQDAIPETISSMSESACSALCQMARNLWGRNRERYHHRYEQQNKHCERNREEHRDRWGNGRFSARFLETSK